MAANATCQPAQMRRPAAVLLAASLLLGCADDEPDAALTPVPTTEASTTTSSPAPATGETDRLGGFQPEPLAWEGCGGRNECATLVVPLDWADPTGPTIELALIRIPAGDPEARIGALATNPGGPGASGIDFVRGGGPFAGSILADRFDVVSWDPRGVGGSAPLRCDDTVEDRFLRLDSDPDDPAEQAALDQAAAAYAASCGAEDAALLAHVGTDDAAFDLEAIRRAMGLPLAYVGFSYGTFIGLRYAELFPTGARSIVIDGVVDPADGLPDLLRGQTVAFERVLTQALGDAAPVWDDVAAAVERAPIPTDDGRGLGPADLATGTVLAGYDESLWPVLREAVLDAADGDGSLMLALADEYRDLGSYAAYQAVSCVDSEHPVGAEAWAAFAAELEGLSPRFGAAVANEMLPCAFWSVPAEPVVGPVRAEGSPPILVLGTTGDPATPVEQAERVAAGLADGHLLVFDGEGHTAYGRDACVDRVVEAYLVDGSLPAPGARCP
jgi:pimeloyl-ACP methyl ester carboxylesterase